ncbi:MAG TPA: hypothetical protein VF230_12715 [Acidimicrobiales bacterium]
MVLIVLAAIWAALLLPPILRARAENRPSGSISEFRRQLHTLARTSPAGPLQLRATPTGPVPINARRAPAARPSGLSRSRRSVKRRRDVFVGLLVAMVASAVLGFLPPLRALWAVHVVVDVLFAAYVAVLVYLRNLAAERDMKVRFLPTAASAPEPALLYRRSGT